MSTSDLEATRSPSSVPSHTTSSTYSDVEVPTVPRGPRASPQQVADVQHWWSTEIEPYKALILGPHEARLVDAMSQVDQMSYGKYRYDVHFYYKNVPPPREMWQEGILDMHTPESQRWLLQKELAEMYEASCDEDH